MYSPHQCRIWIGFRFSHGFLTTDIWMAYRPTQLPFISGLLSDTVVFGAMRALLSNSIPGGGREGAPPPLRDDKVWCSVGRGGWGERLCIAGHLKVVRLLHG